MNFPGIRQFLTGIPSLVPFFSVSISGRQLTNEDQTILNSNVQSNPHKYEFFQDFNRITGDKIF